MSIHQIKFNTIVKLLFPLNCSFQHFICILYEVQTNDAAAVAVTECATCKNRVCVTFGQHFFQLNFFLVSLRFYYTNQIFTLL